MCLNCQAPDCYSGYVQGTHQMRLMLMKDGGLRRYATMSQSFRDLEVAVHCGQGHVLRMFLCGDCSETL
jgi:hypothetical protein